MQANLTLPESGKLPDLIIFDVDGTLIDRASGQLLPGRQEFFHSLWQYPKLKLALASNQGGVGFRHWLESMPPKWFAEKSEAEQAERLDIHPTQAEAEDRIKQVEFTIKRFTQKLKPFPLPIRSYLSFIYEFKNGSYTPRPPGTTGRDPRWLQAWRKPNAGMLLQAMADAGVTKTQTLMVGDREEDRGAANRVGCALAMASDFFNNFQLSLIDSSNE